MSHVDSGPLATYNSLQDKHLVGFFNNTRMRRHLRRSGLITRNGEIVTENTFRLNMARREHQKHVRDLMAQAIVHKALDMERHRQTEIKKKLEEIAKVEMVQRVRSTRGHKGDEDITPYLSPRAPSGRPKSAKQERPRSVVSGHRPATAPSKHSGTSKKKSAIYVDKEGFPVHRDQAWGASEDASDEIDSHNLRELDPDVLNCITLNMSPEEKQNYSPYNVDLTLPEPRPPPRTSQGSGKSPRGTSRTVITRDGRRIRPKSNKGSLLLHRKEPAYPHPTQQQTLCDVTIRYRGNNLKLQYEREDKRDEIIINQQHCGGENLIVFHGLVEPGTDLVFTSRRHRGYPFSLTFYVNQIQVLRLSACCEYKYGPGVLLGGRKGHFKFGRVDGSSPCYRCMVEAELARRERQRYKDTQTEEPKPEAEQEPNLESQGTQSEPSPPETRDQTEQAEAGEAAEAEAYDDEDFEDEDDREASDSEKGETPKADDKRSDHFFSGPESDAEQKQPQEADYAADSDFEAESNHEKQEDEKENEVNEEEQEEADEIQEGEAKDDNIPDEIPAEEPVKDEADESIREQTKMEEVAEEQEENLSIPDALRQTDDDKEPQTSRHDESDSSSDSEGDNKVLSSSSSSSSSSEDEDDQKTSKAVKETAHSSSDFSSEDEAEAKKTEGPTTDDKIASDAEKNETKEEGAQQGLDEEAAQMDVSSDRRADDSEEQEKRSLSPPASEKGDILGTAKAEQDVKDSPSENAKEVEDEDTEKPSSPVAKEEERDEKKDEVLEKEEKDEDDEEKEDKSFLGKLADKVKDAFTSSDSSSSDSASDESKDKKKKKKRRKRKTKSRSSSSDEEKSEKSESDSDKDKKKSFFEKLKDKFTSSDSESDSGKEKEKNKNKSKSEEEDVADKDASSKDQKRDDEQEKEPEPLNDEEENRKSSKDEEEKQTQDVKESKVLKTSPAEEKAEEKGSIDKMDKIKGGFGSSDSSDSEDGNDENKKTEDVKESEEATAPQKEDNIEEKGWIDKMEDKISGMFGSSDSEEDGEGTHKIEEAQKSEDEEAPAPEEDEDDADKIEKEEQEIAAEAELPTEVAPSASEHEARSPEPPQEEQEETKSEIGKTEEKDHDMLGPSDSEDNEDKPEDREESIKSEDAETGAIPIAEDEEPKSSAPQDNSQMQSDKEDGKEKDEVSSTASLEKDSAQEDKDGDATQSKDDASDKAEDDGKEADEEANEEAEKKEEFSGGGDAAPKEAGTDHSEPKDEDDGKKDTRGDDASLKDELKDDGSMSSRSSVSESGSIAAGLDKDYRFLNLNDKNLDESKAVRLAKALKRRKYCNLEYLLLRGNPLTDSGVATVIRSLIEKHNATNSALKLTHLDLGSSGMGDEAAAELSKLLALDTQLRNLNISENTLSAAAWQAIIEGLKVNKSLVTFSAEYAHLSDTSCVMLTDGLADHERLEELNIEGNGLGERAGSALAQLVKDNSVIVTVNLEKDNSISPKIQTEIKEILETGSYVP